MWTVLAFATLGSLPARAETPDEATEAAAAEDAAAAPAAEEAATSTPQDNGLTPVRPAYTTGDTLGMTSSSGTPEYYVVQEGDTLWEISSRFLGNAYYWPKLWSINEQVTNPHWIYPGNRIRFTMGTLLEPPDVGLDGGGGDSYTVSSLNYGESESACGPDVRFNQTLQAGRYQALTFLADDDDLDVLGRVPKARTMQTHLAEGDLLYLDMDDPDAYDCGDLVLIFRPVQKKIRHPNDRATRYGTLYRVVGEARVTHRNEGYVSAIVRTSYSEIERGDLVGPVIPLSVELEVQKPKGDVEGTIVARGTTEALLASTGEVVFLDRGRADGLKVGSSMYVVESRDENLDIEAEDRDLPESVIGRVVVVRLDEYSATAVVTDAARPIDVGQRLAMEVD